jgi:hypothetical protein
VTAVAGEPEIVGAVFVGGVGAGVDATTAMENAGSVAVLLPSLTRITMLDQVPVRRGTPVSMPEDRLKYAHEGLLLMLKYRRLPSASLAAGLKEYQLPTTTLVGGDPEITGGAARAGCVKKEAMSSSVSAKSWPRRK